MPDNAPSMHQGDELHDALVEVLYTPPDVHTDAAVLAQRAEASTRADAVMAVVSEVVSQRLSGQAGHIRALRRRLHLAADRIRELEDRGLRTAWQQGYEFALTHLDDDPIQADRARYLTGETDT